MKEISRWHSKPKTVYSYGGVDTIVICKSLKFNIIVIEGQNTSKHSIIKLYKPKNRDLHCPEELLNYKGKAYPRRYLESTPDSRASAIRPVRAT